MEKSKEQIAPEFSHFGHLIHSSESPARNTNAIGATYL